MKIGDTFEHHAPRGLQDYDPFERPVWHGLITPPQKEKAAREYLKANGIHAFYPDEKVRRVVQGRKRTIVKPMVSGFVFARFTGRPNWDVIRARPFFVGVISLFGRPYPIPRPDIQRMRGLTITAEERRRALRERQEAAQAALMPIEGERARLVDGPLKGFMVEVTKVSGGMVSYLLPNGIPGTASVGAVERTREG